MNRTLCFAAMAWFAFVLSASQASAQAYGPMDNRVGGSVGGPAAVLPDSRVDSRTDSRTGSPGNRAPQGFEASRTTCYKNGEVVDRAIVEDLDMAGVQVDRHQSICEYGGEHVRQPGHLDLRGRGRW